MKPFFPPGRSGCRGEEKYLVFPRLGALVRQFIDRTSNGSVIGVQYFFLYSFNDIASTAGYIVSNELICH